MASPPWKNIQNFQSYQKLKTYNNEKFSQFTTFRQEEFQPSKIITLMDLNNSQSKFLVRTTQHTTINEILDQLKKSLGQNYIYQLFINNQEISEDDLHQNAYNLLGNTYRIYFQKNYSVPNSQNSTTRERYKSQRQQNQFFRSTGNYESHRSIKNIQNQEIQEIQGKVNQFYSQNDEALIQNFIQNNFTQTEQHIETITNQINNRLGKIEQQISKIFSKDQEQDEQIKQLFKLFQQKQMESSKQQKELQQNQGIQEKQQNIATISEQEIKQKLVELQQKQISLENQFHNFKLDFKAKFSDQNQTLQKQKQTQTEIEIGNQGSIIPREAQIYLILQCHHLKDIEVQDQILEIPIIKDNSKICTQCNKPFSQICRNLGFIGKKYLEKQHQDNLKIIYENQKKLNPDEFIKCKNCDFFCKVNPLYSYYQNNFCPVCNKPSVTSGSYNQEQHYQKKS